MTATSAAETLTRWATPAPEMGSHVYRVTPQGQGEYKHTYHLFCPWSPDGRLLLLARYDRTDPSAAICVMETATGAVREVGRSHQWETHTMAFQQWQGNRERILYKSADKAGPTVVTVRPDGSDERVFPAATFDAWTCSPDGGTIFGNTPLTMMFPDDAIAPRDDKGLLAMDLETGEQRLVFAFDALPKLFPDWERMAHCHLYAKAIITHRRLPRVLFNLTNTFWDRDGQEPKVRTLITIGFDGADPRSIGPCVHHPNWHSVDNRVVANLHDFTGTLRFGLYPGDGRGLLEYIPRTRGSGHPSFSPDGRWLCTDASGPRGNQLILCNPLCGHARVVMECDFVSDGYASFKSIDERQAGETVMDALARAKRTPSWQTQAHPAWSRDGSAILFNRDIGNGSEVFMIDAAAATAED